MTDDGRQMTAVQCHSGYEYAQRPVVFQWEEKKLVVSRVIGEWKTPDGKLFRVLTKGDQVFDLLYNTMEDEWITQQQ